MRSTLRKQEILRGNESFRKIISSGEKIFEKNILCFYLIEENSVIVSNQIRAGFTVPKKTGTAVIRNRIKRLMREGYRLSKFSLIETETVKKFIVSIVFIYNINRKDTIKKLNLHVIKPEIVKSIERIKKNLISADSD